MATSERSEQRKPVPQRTDHRGTASKSGSGGETVLNCYQRGRPSNFRASLSSSPARRRRLSAIAGMLELSACLRKRLARERSCSAFHRACASTMWSSRFAKWNPARANGFRRDLPCLSHAERWSRKFGRTGEPGSAFRFSTGAAGGSDREQARRVALQRRISVAGARMRHGRPYYSRGCLGDSCGNVLCSRVDGQLWGARSRAARPVPPRR
jgi:hypothetical protein